MPDKIEVLNCPVHGDYEVKYMNAFNGKIWVNDSCSDCIKQSDEKIRISDELKKKEQHDKVIADLKHSKRIRAGISKRNLYKGFDDYNCSSEGQTKAISDCKRFVETFPSDKSLIMVGGVGTGKTLLASIIIEKLVDKNKCEIIKLIEIIRSLKASWSKDNDTDEQGVIDYFIGLDLLIIDEVGSQFGSDTEKLFIFEIIDGRYQDMKQTILISNLDIDGIKEVIGERCVDRLREGGGSMIAFDWKSSRV
jgi:DNA replication protein DnaC